MCNFHNYLDKFSGATWAKARSQALRCLQVYTDSDVSTKYHWARPHVLSPESTATITWDIPEGTFSGSKTRLAADCVQGFSILSGDQPYQRHLLGQYQVKVQRAV